VVQIAIGSDHAGFELKELLKSQLELVGDEVIDFGTDLNLKTLRKTCQKAEKTLIGMKIEVSCNNRLGGFRREIVMAWK
jgi:ribose 5-phosphate isomerase RpiB